MRLSSSDELGVMLMVRLVPTDIGTGKVNDVWEDECEEAGRSPNDVPAGEY